MFGVTTPCIQQISKELEADYDCLVFHATGSGGKAMEKLADDHLFDSILDLTTTEVCDYLFGGVLACDEDRFGAIARSQTPYIGSCGALDMVNFGRPSTVPEKYTDRQFYHHNAQVTLMRTTPKKMHRWGAGLRKNSTSVTAMSFLSFRKAASPPWMLKVCLSGRRMQTAPLLRRSKLIINKQKNVFYANARITLMTRIYPFCH